MGWSILLGVAKKYWSQLALGLLVLGLSISLGITRHTLSSRTETLHNTVVAYQNFQNEVKNKTEAAQVADQKHADTIHAQDEAIRTKNETSLQARLDAAQSAAADYAAKLRNQSKTNSGSGGAPSSSPAANPSGTTPDAGKDPVLDDARICAENTVKAQGWLDWWKEVSAVPDRQ